MHFLTSAAQDCPIQWTGPSPRCSWVAYRPTGLQTNRPRSLHAAHMPVQVILAIQTCFQHTDVIHQTRQTNSWHSAHMPVQVILALQTCFQHTDVIHRRRFCRRRSRLQQQSKPAKTSEAQGSTACRTSLSGNHLSGITSLSGNSRISRSKTPASGGEPLHHDINERPDILDIRANSAQQRSLIKKACINE